MKKALILFLAAIVVATAWGQQATYDKIKATTVLEIPKYASLSAATSAGSKAGNLVYVYATADSGFKVRNIANSGWINIPLEGSGGGSTYQAGNGIKIDGTTIMLSDSIATVSLVTNPFGSYKIKQIFIPGSDYGLLSLENSSTILGTLNSSNSYYSLIGTSGSGASMTTYGGNNEIIHYKSGVLRQKIKLDNNGIQLVTKDSIWVRDSINVGYPYAPTTTTTDNFKAFLMNASSGAIVTSDAALLKRQTSGTPSGTADSQGTQGDMLYDDSYIYIKTSAGWKRVSLSTF
jgi:hypothetical protein